MTSRETLKFRVKDKGGALGGKEITSDIPVFDFEEFMRSPNADEFVKKAYYAAAKKITRELEEGKNGTVAADLSSFEMIIARTLNFTRSDIQKWLAGRDWSKIAKFEKASEIRTYLEDWLPQLASRVNAQHAQFSNKVAEKVITELSDKKDPIADYLFVLLTVKRESKFENLLGF